MITSIRIDDNKKTPFKYIPKIKAFKNGSEFIFKPGVNVIVGKNGSRPYRRRSGYYPRHGIGRQWSFKVGRSRSD